MHLRESATAGSAARASGVPSGVAREVVPKWTIEKEKKNSPTLRGALFWK
jgi:hypothetical protein